MIHFIAIVAILALLCIAQVGNYWFTFGLWPQSWSSFALFSVISTVLSVMFSAVNKDLGRRQ